MIAMTIASLVLLLRALKLPTMARHADEVAQLAEREGWTYVRYVHHLVELEVHERRRRRIARNLKDSELPPDKTLATLHRARLPAKVAKVLPALCEGAFVERGDNLLAFGLPGRGKMHLVCAIGHELIQRGYRVLFTPTYALVQRLLTAKRDLRLEQETNGAPRARQRPQDRDVVHVRNQPGAMDRGQCGEREGLVAREWLRGECITMRDRGPTDHPEQTIVPEKIAIAKIVGQRVRRVAPPIMDTEQRGDR